MSVRKTRAAEAREAPLPEGHRRPSSESTAPSRKSDVSRTQILSVAARLFRDQGYAGTSLRQIATAAGMKAGSIYYHFSSKDELLDEILDVGLRRVFEAVREAAGSEPPRAGGHRARIERAVEAHLVTLLKESEYTSVNVRIYGQLPADVKRRHRKLRRLYGEFWDTLFTAAREAGEIRSDMAIRPLRMFVLGALNWTVEWFDGRRSSVRDLADRTSALIFEGIERPRAGSSGQAGAAPGRA